MYKKVIFGISGLLFLLLIFLLLSYSQYEQERDEKSIRQGEYTTAELVTSVDSILGKVVVSGNRIAADLKGLKASRQEVLDLVKTESYKMDALLGVTVAYEPYAFDSASRLFAPYFDKNSRDYIFIEDVYDYTDTNLTTSKWYTNVRDHGSGWVEPYYAEGAKTLVADYGVPFYNNKGEVIGTVTMTISLQGFTDLVHNLSLGRSGYGFVCSPEGLLLAHPINNFLGRKKLTELPEAQRQEEVRQAYEAMLSGESGHLEYTDEESRRKTLLFYDQAENAGWGIGIVFFKQELLGKAHALKSKKTLIAAVIGLLLLFLALIGLRIWHFNPLKAWVVSGLTTFILLLNILYLWKLQHNDTEADGVESLVVTDHAVLNRFVQIQQRKAELQKTDSLLCVPTGIYLNRLDFDDAYNIEVSGYVWQHYPKGILEEINPGISLPQTTPFAEASFIREAYREEQANSTLIGWEFRHSLRMNFNYRNFPFDKRNVNIRVLPREVKHNLLLVPDLSSYRFISPSLRPGISEDVELPGDELMRSYFAMSITEYNTDFGFASKNHFEKLPELSFNIEIRRILINAFISYLIPIVVVLLMMFILINTSGKTSNRLPRLGIMESLSAFFFVLIFSHIDLRKGVETAQLMYMEYFYFISYMMLILSVYNLILYTRREGVLFFDYRDNLIVKLSFWPLFLFIVYVFTLINFYY